MSPGRLFVSYAASDTCLNGSLVWVDVLSWLLSGRKTVVLDAPSTSKCNSSLMKWDVVMESIIILCSFYRSIHHFHLFDFFSAFTGIDCTILTSSSSLLFLLLFSFSGVQLFVATRYVSFWLILSCITPGCHISVFTLDPTHLQVLLVDFHING